MNVSPTNNAIGLLHSAQQKAADAAHEIATLPVNNEETGSTEFNSTELFSPVLQLKESEFETKAAVKILQTENETLGTLLDIKA